MEKVFYTIGEVAEILGESASLVRYWTNTFSKYLKPKRNAKGNRLYKKEDIDTIKQIHLLVKTEGMTLEGAAARLAQDRKPVDSKVKILESLREIRAQLNDVRKML